MNRPKSELIEELRKMLQDVLVARHGGANYQRIARAHGYVDGYMRGLMESGVATREDLLKVVADERSKVGGPSTLTADTAAEFAA